MPLTGTGGRACDRLLESSAHAGRSLGELPPALREGFELAPYPVVGGSFCVPQAFSFAGLIRFDIGHSAPPSRCAQPALRQRHRWLKGGPRSRSRRMLSGERDRLHPI
jgi:hypothetical protein